MELGENKRCCTKTATTTSLLGHRKASLFIRWHQVNIEIYNQLVQKKRFLIWNDFLHKLRISLVHLNQPAHAMDTVQSYSITVIHMYWISSQIWKHYVLWLSLKINWTKLICRKISSNCIFFLVIVFQSCEILLNQNDFFFFHSNRWEIRTMTTANNISRPLNNTG